MPVSQAQFDADFNPFITAVGALCTAVGNLNLTGDDLSAEEQAVVDSAAAVQTALNKLNPPPPPKPA
jgi:hypothetical protein